MACIQGTTDTPVRTNPLPNDTSLLISSSTANPQPTASLPSPASPTTSSIPNSSPSVVPSAISAATDSPPSSTEKLQPRTTILSLPPELHLNIFECLDTTRDLIVIQQTHRILRDVFLAHCDTICEKIERRRWKMEARLVVDLLRESQADWRASMRWVLRRLLDAYRDGLYDMLALRPTTGFTRLAILEKLDRDVVRPWTKEILHRPARKKKGGVIPPSDQEIERAESAIYNVLRMTECLNSMGLNKKYEPYRSSKNGDVEIWDASTTGFDLWKAILDIRGMTEKFTIEEHMRMVRALSEPSFDLLLCYHPIREMLLITLWDRSIDFRKMDWSKREDTENLMSMLIQGSLRDDKQVKIKSFLSEYMGDMAWDAGVNIDRYMVRRIITSHQGDPEEIVIWIPNIQRWQKSVWDWCDACERVVF